MSDLKTPRPVAASTLSTHDVAPSSRTFDVLTLGVDIGVVAPAESLMAPAAKETVAARADSYELRPDSTRNSRKEDASRVESQADPFASLSRRIASEEPRKLSERQSALTEELELSPMALARLAALQVKDGAADSARLGKLRLGVMLLVSDAQGAKKLPVDEAALTRIAARLAQGQTVSKQDAEAFWRSQARFVASSRASIQDYVQRVLRESYLIQNSMLFDYAERVRALNDRKQKLRELAKTARDTRAAWLAEKGNVASETWVAAQPLDYVDLDENNKLFTAQMTEQDVAAERAIDGRQSAPEGASDIAADYNLVFGESRLNADDLDVLKALKKYRGVNWRLDGLTDNYIRDHIDQLLAVIPSMNERDLEKHLLPILKRLTDGVSDDAEIVAIFGALSSVQLLTLWSHGAKLPNRDGDTPPTHDPVRDREVARPRGTIASWGRHPLTAIGGLALQDIQLKANRQARQVAEQVGGKISGDLDVREAAILLSALRAQQTHREEAAAQTEGTQAGPGAPKRIRTLEQLDAYLKHLEEQMNGAGDDAQLANVDLQNALQKQQQTLQMMSNISKMLHDTALAIVRKTGQ
ncbi:MAG: hypothetical protein AAB426_10085 [Myxococcota bacterium]